MLLAQDGTWLDVPFVKQQENLCGAACVSMVLLYWEKASNDSSIPSSPQVPKSPNISEIIAALRSSESKGIYGSQMNDYLTSQGYQSFVFKGAWKDIENHLSKGRPLIVALGNKEKLDHFAVVTGQNPLEETVLLNDPARKKLFKMARSDFEKNWKKTGFWTLLALPPTFQ